MKIYKFQISVAGEALPALWHSKFENPLHAMQEFISLVQKIPRQDLSSQSKKCLSNMNTLEFSRFKEKRHEA